MKLRKELNDKVVEAIESYNKGGFGTSHLSKERLTFEVSECDDEDNCDTYNSTDVVNIYDLKDIAKEMGLNND